MIGFAACIGSQQTFARRLAPGFVRVREPDSVLAELTEHRSIHTAYNEALDHFAAIDELEALVLLHEDVELLDASFCDRLRDALRDERVAIVGAIGAAGVTSLAWWEGRMSGRVAESRGLIDHGFAVREVDAVDGMMLALSPWAVRNLRFDADTYAGFHAYDVDICFAARAAGRAVVVADLPLAHYTKGGYGDRAAWDAANAAFRRKWRLDAPADALAAAQAVT